jgi:hypothetical protein
VLDYYRWPVLVLQTIMNEIRVKIEIAVTTPLNVAELRQRLWDLDKGDNPINTALMSVVDGTDALIQGDAASYNTRFGRKPGR